MSEVCGSRRVTETVEGHEYRIAWCGRIDGPCPFPGAPESRASSRKCADSPGRRLAVTYSDEAVDAARERLRVYVERLENRGNPSHLIPDDVHIAVAALTACIGDES